MVTIWFSLNYWQIRTLFSLLNGDCVMNIKRFTPFLFWFILSVSVFPYPGKILQKHESPCTFPSGLAFDGINLWLADHKKDKLICIDTKTGNTLKEIDSPAFWPTGLTWDGQYLWNIDKKENKIYQIDPTDGTIQKSIDIPTRNPEGLAWDGETLWISDTKLDALIKIDLTDGTALTILKAPVHDPQGLTFDGRFLWCADRKVDEIHMIDPSSGEVIMILKSPGPFPRGLTWDGSSLWNIDFQTDSLYRLVRNDNEIYHLTNQRTAWITLHHEVKIWGKGRLQNFNLYIAIPENRYHQKIYDIEWTPADYRVISDQYHQSLAHFEYHTVESDSTLSTRVRMKSEVSEIQYFIFPENVGSLDEIPPEIINKYTSDGSKYQINHPTIQNLVTKIINQEKNPYWIARKIFNFIHHKLEYHYEGGWNVAPFVIERGTGSCSEYTFSFIALCRAAGLPARYVGALVVRGDDASLDELFHRWAEVYLPGYGWIPIDPQGGDKSLPRDRAMGIGHLSNRFLVTTQGGGDSKYLEWYYISHENYKVDPQVQVNIETFGEWEPIRE